jgi:hypothetical protein
LKERRFAMKRIAFVICIGLLLVSAPTVEAQGPTVPDGFEVTLLASGLNAPKGIVSPLHRAGAGPFGHYLYVAEAQGDDIAKVDKAGAGATLFADSVGDFPVGVAFFGGPFGNNLYVGNAFGGGIVKVDPSGTVSPFALPGNDIAGLDFGRGHYGSFLYAGEWSAGNIYQVDPSGAATLFATVAGTQTRYLKFSHGGAFGTFLYFTDFWSGDIYQVDPSGVATLFASTGTPSLEGLDFSPGGAFGHFLYAGALSTGDIFRVAPDGSVELWASGFGGVADIHFEPGKRGGFTMYISDGQSPGHVYAISKAKK